MHIWSRPELYVSVIAVIGATVVAIYLTAPGRLRAKERKRLERSGGDRPPDRAPRPVQPGQPVRAGHGAPSAPGDTVDHNPLRNPGEMVLGGGAPVGPVPMAAEHTSTRFTDLAGLDEAITELSEVREYLSDPSRFLAVGAELPRGILLFGPPGCGKTLLARALAGETGVPFFSVSAASFVEQMVGLGAARVRQLFDEARKAAPSIVFIDELDAIGRSRDEHSSGGREFDHTLNQLLVELDGFGGTSGVLLIGATNRPELIDAALMRPGRFDRRLQIERPDRRGREQILRLHAAKRPVSLLVNWAEVAADTSGLNGAELANIVNESALLAARRRQECIEPEDVWEAVHRVVAGTGSSRLIRDDERHLRATHEAGHALLTLLLRGMRPPARVSIVTRKGAFERSAWSTADDRETLTKRELMAQLIVLLGGRAAEIHTFGEPSTRAEDDLQHAATLARRMVEQWAMTGRFELASGEGGKRMPYVEGSAGGAEVRTLLSGAEQAARTILSDNESSLQLIAATLADRETLSAAELDELHRSGVTSGTGISTATGEYRVRPNRRDVIDLPSQSRADLSPRPGGVFEDPSF
ncbi:MAG: AAA family ATPase [Actinomycetota bacterium]|nr:AAA family ATPase [Actinomycetota bacterium]